MTSDRPAALPPTTFHLPGLGPISTSSHNFRGDALALPTADLTPALLDRQIELLRAARDRELQDRPVREIVQVIDRVAGRLLDAAEPLRQEAVDGLAAVTGFSAPMTRYILDRMAADWREGPLLALLEAEFGKPEVLDRFERVRPQTSRQAIGPGVTFHTFAGNVPGVAVTSLIRTLLVKSASLAKTASGEPVLAPLFARALKSEDDGLGDCLAVAYWSGTNTDLAVRALGGADAVIAYGGKRTVESLRARTPQGVPFLGYGHHVSFGVVGREALTGDDARGAAVAAALATATFDQHGCVSPHLFYVEEGGEVSPAGWAEMVAGELEALEVELPRGALSAGESIAIREARSEAEFARLAGGRGALHVSPGGTAWTVILDPDPSFVASCLNRLVRVKPVASLEQVADLVAPFGRALQTVGYAGAQERFVGVAERLARVGATRITDISSMPWPPPQWRHDGRPPLADLVRWSDLEHR